MARSKEGKLLETKQRAAALFVNGPQRTRGNWEETCKLLGVELDPADEDVKRFIEAEGGQPPVIAVKPGAFNPTPAPTGGLLGMLAAPDAKSDDEWCKLADELKDTIKGIAAGTVKASAAQSATVRHILDRCYGRVQEKASEKKPASGVLILPVMGASDAMSVCALKKCPQCGYEDKPEA